MSPDGRLLFIGDPCHGRPAGQNSDGRVDVYCRIPGANTWRLYSALDNNGTGSIQLGRCVQFVNGAGLVEEYRNQTTQAIQNPANTYRKGFFVAGHNNVREFVWRI